MPFSKDDVGAAVLEALARQAFGARTKLLDWRFLGAGTGNLAYVVAVDADPRRFVFRFNRGLREDVYEAEAANYATVASATGVRVPEIVSIDRSRASVPTSYMVLEHLSGQEHTSLCRPDNDGVSLRQRQQIRARLGDFYARLHGRTRPAGPGEGMTAILFGISQLHAAVAAGHLTVDLDLVTACEAAVRNDQALETPTLAFCLSDGEIYFQPAGDAYELAFVCDLEWAGFDYHLADLTRQAVPARGLVDLDDPVTITSDDLRRDPFFIAYEQAGGTVAYDAVSRLALYTQLSTWGNIAAEPADPGKKQWIRDRRLPLINRLLAQVAATGG